MFPTDDGSISLKSTHFDETYHSKFGAVGESQHVFICAGLQKWYSQNLQKQPIRIFEMGFGTGLNAVLALQWAENMKIPIVYHAIELFPLTANQLNALNHADFVNDNLREKVYKIQHEDFCRRRGRVQYAPMVQISPYFVLCKQQISLLDVELPDDYFDVIFFDAFSPNVQPELWTKNVFQKLFNASRKNAVLTTYCVKGEIRSALKFVGFYVEKIPGPIGKREITRAYKEMLAAI
ncbi:MAG: tRNA (5-methylaminomethyl-2-thiouridine)(34)-methyltransferase MnmD [Bacteroidales bacterium]|jgi:tRNA U34 5-methylaminomethyl-2-thiouridine-forming methyltransferase MnmC|nr:tRNA (5-methylaminomethyl-2-thiouridine)(34)-methyltransferase MnmD [Bacteroidales bacterium]